MPNVIEKTDQRNLIYQQLKLQILNLNLHPGERLSENTLSEQMGVSRPMIRDALSRLVEEGYVVVYPQRGTEVTLLHTEKIRQTVFSYTILEQAIMEELCRHGLTGTQISQLESLLQRQKAEAEKKDLFHFLMAEQEFYYLLCCFCAKEYVWEVFRTIDCDLLRLNYLQYTTFNYKIDMSSLTSLEHVQVESRILLDHLKRQDSEAACLICANHFNTILWNAGTLREIYPQFFSAA